MTMHERISRIPYDQLVLNDRVHGGIYTMPEIFDEELERIFHRGWVYVGHESEIPNPGDFQTRHVGRQPVIYVRGEDGEARVLMNRCTHRGAVVCPHESGNAKRFTCLYHGWVFRNTGDLFGVAHPERYGDDFKKSEYGLRPAPRIGTYRGLMFASLAKEGPSLDEHLGPLAKAEIDIAFDLSPTGKIDVNCGIHKYGYDGNWKLQVENATDGYHLGYLHRSFLRIGAERSGRDPTPMYSGQSPFRLRSLGNGHVAWDMTYPGADPIMMAKNENLPAEDRAHIESLVEAHGETRARRLLSRGAAHVLIFPNLVFIQSHIRVVRPISVNKTEVFLYPYRLCDTGEAMNARRLGLHQAFYGPAGGGATDDLEAFDRIDEGLRAIVDPWVLISRGLGQERQEEDGAITGQITDELNNRAILHHWKRVMTESAAQSKL